MIATVSSVYFNCIFRIHCHKSSGQCHQPSGNPCRNIICHIIKLSCTSSKIQIFIIFISKHGVHGIDTFIQKHQGNPTNRHIKHRRNDSVRRILRNSLHCCLSDANFRKLLGITSYDHRNCITGFLYSSIFQTVIYLHTLRLQGFRCKQLSAPKGFQYKSSPEVPAIQQMDHKTGNTKGEYTYKDYFQNAACQLSFICFRKNFPDSLFQYADQISDEAYRMVQPPWISHKQVKNKACRKS